MSHDEINRVMFDQVFNDPVRSDLDVAEMEIISQFREHWPSWDILELGSGDGRVAFTLGAIAQSYLGIDYAPNMVAKAQQRFGDDDRRQFLHGDARDLSMAGTSRFDMVWFPFNGLDNVGHSDRSRILSEVHRVLRPDGYFYFSCHSMDSMPFQWEWPKLRPFRLRTLASATQVLGEDVMMRKRSRSVDLDQARRQGWSVFTGPGPFRTFYSTMQWQIQALDDAGFITVRTLNAVGQDIISGKPDRSESLHYLCQRQSDDTPISGEPAKH